MPQAEIGALRVRLAMDAGEFSSGASSAEARMDQLGRKMRALGGQMARIGGVMSVAVTAPLAMFAKISVEKFQTQEKAIAAVEAALRSMGRGAGFTSQQLQDMASRMQAMSTFGDEDILGKVTANLLTFGNISGQVFERAQQAALDLSARLGQDLQSSAIMLGKALNEPAAGLTALTRVGVSFTEQQKEQIEAMAEAGDAAGAQALMLAELERQYGGQAAAMAETTAGQMAQLNNSWGDFQEQIGAILVEVLPPLVSMLGEVVTWLQGLDQETLQWVVGIGAAAAALGPLVAGVGGLVAGLGALLPVVATVGGAVLGLIAATGPIGLFIAAAATALAAWELFGTGITDLFERITGFVVEKFGFLLEQITFVTDAIGEAWTTLSDYLVGNSVIPDMVDMMLAEFQRLDDGVTRLTAKTTNTVAAGYGGAAKKAGVSFDQMANDVTGALQTIFGDSKAAAIAIAIINTAQGVTRALAAYPPPLSFAMAGLQAAAGAAQIAAIRSTNMGGGGGGGGGGGAVGSGAAAAASAEASGGAGASQGVFITLEGDSFGRDQVRGLITKINEEVRDGAQLVVA